MRRKTKNAKIIVGTAVLGLLLVAVLLILRIPSAMNAQQRKLVSRTRLEIKNLSTALDLYAVQVGDYPTTEQGLEALWRAPRPIPQNWSGPYIKNENFLDPWGNSYVYRYPGIRSDYDLYSRGKDAKIGGENFDADITNWSVRDQKGIPLHIEIWIYQK